MADFIPSVDAQLLAFAQNFSTKISGTPLVFGLVAADATNLATQVSAFSSALTTATTPGTRTAVTVAAKETARTTLVADLRSLARRVQATLTVTVAQKTDLGLPIRDVVPSPVPAPATKPALDLRGIDRQSHLILIADETTPTRRARPAGAIGAEVYAFIGAPGATPPADLKHWEYMGLASKSEFTVSYEAADANKQAVIVARWVNRRGESGPVSNPITGSVAA